ncbi:MAG: hypothetical protein GX575_24045 [Candidatus Anammoximicrobium sp.]|nr:hypothetical protein [Candidatus Anammoximicrobium sp.]
MCEFLRSTPAQAVIWGTTLIVLCIVGVYVVRRFRERDDGGQPMPSEWLTGFREISERGEITPQEFRQIKTVLGTKLQHDLDSEDTEGDG